MISDELFITCARALLDCPPEHTHISERFLIDFALPNMVDPRAFRAALALAYQAGAASVSGCVCGDPKHDGACDGNGCTCTHFQAVSS